MKQKLILEKDSWERDWKDEHNVPWEPCIKARFNGDNIIIAIVIIIIAFLTAITIPLTMWLSK